MRLAGVLVVPLFALGLVACGGGGDDDAAATTTTEAAARTVESDDGLASLELPDGAPADVTLTAVDGGDALRTYRLEPSGTTFADEPARLTVREVETGERGRVVATYLDGEPVAGEADYGEAGTMATVTVEVPHFSELVIRKGSGAVTFDAPDQVAVGVPFTVNVTASWLERGMVGKNDVPITIDGARFVGDLEAVRLTPTSVDDAPDWTALPFNDRRTFSYTFSCPQKGNANVRLSATYVEGPYSGPEEAIQFLSSGFSIVLAEGMACGTPPPVPTVTAVGARLEVPITTYYVEATAPPGAVLTYRWRMAGEACGTPRVPFDGRDDTGLGFGSTMQWSHADTPPDSCAHQSTDHDVTVSVVVTASGGRSVTCVLQGSNAQRIENPPCS